MEPENKYIYLQEWSHPTGKTRRFDVINRRSEMPIGTVQWYGAWRQYVLMPRPGTVWNPDCLRFVNEKITELMEERRAARAR